jgi:endonuclease-3
MKAKKKTPNVFKIINILGELYPDTKCELQYADPFQLLVSTILAAQATDKKVNEITAKLFKKYKTPKDFIFLTQNELEQEIKQIHLYPAKARYILSASKTLVKEFCGEVPAERDKLMSLAGVGRKTANVVLSYAFNIPSIAVDTHVFRVANRLGIVNAKNPQQTELEMEKIIPEELWSKAHSSMVLHGRRVCDARNPKCGNCGLNEYCTFFNKGGLR